MADTSTMRERRKETSHPPISVSSPFLTKTTTNVTTPSKSKKKKTANDYAREEDGSGISLVEVLRSLVFLAIASCGLSYIVTRESYVWGLKRPAWTKQEFLKSYWATPLHLTDADLPSYSGTSPDPLTPIYLAINGSIYDVSAGRKHYGPGGSYHFFAGVDASRAFVTQCFDEDRTPDMRGVEEMFIPIDDAETDRLIEERIGKGGMKKLRERERREARRSVESALGHWTGFFEGSAKYPKVGMVHREKGWETKGPKPTLCARAQKGRKKRVMPEGDL